MNITQLWIISVPNVSHFGRYMLLTDFSGPYFFYVTFGLQKRCSLRPQMKTLYSLNCHSLFQIRFRLLKNFLRRDSDVSALSTIYLLSVPYYQYHNLCASYILQVCSVGICYVWLAPSKAKFRPFTLWTTSPCQARLCLTSPTTSSSKDSAGPACVKSTLSRCLR